MTGIRSMHSSGPRRWGRGLTRPSSKGPVSYGWARWDGSPGDHRPAVGPDRDMEILSLRRKAALLEMRLIRLNERLSNRTGGRFSKLRAVADEERCVGCGTCEKLCPVGAIAVKDVAWVNPRRCIGCGTCVGQCPRGAIRLRPVNSLTEERAAAVP